MVWQPNRRPTRPGVNVSTIPCSFGCGRTAVIGFVFEYVVQSYGKNFTDLYE
jgi:hypothetical protein